MRLQAASCSSFHSPVQPRRDARLRRDAGHLREDEAGAARSRGRRNGRDASRPARRPSPSTCPSARPRPGWRGPSRAAGTAGTSGTRGLSTETSKPCCRTCSCEGPVDLGHEVRRAQAQVVVGDRLGAGHHAEGELHRVEIPEPRHVLEPDERHVGRVLGLLDLLAPAGFVERTARPRHVGIAPEGLVERDGILHRELGAGADGEMGGRLGVARAAPCCP